MTEEERYLTIADAMLAAADENDLPIREDNTYLLDLLAETARIGYTLRKAEETAEREREE